MWWDAIATLLSSMSLMSFGPAGTVTNWQPTWSPDGKWIAYASDRDGTFSIWKTDGIHVRRVVRGGSDPAWTPRGNTIALTLNASNGGIALAPASGGGSRQVRRYGFQPNWSPDGRRLAFTDPPDACSDGDAIVIMRADGSREEQVSGSSEFEAYYSPTWAPSGRSIAYVHDDYGGSITLEQVFLLPNGDVRYRYVPGASEDAGRVSWSPKGDKLVYTVGGDNAAPGVATRAGFAPMYVLDLRTGRQMRLTRMLGNQPVWSPGGKRIAFAARATDGSTDIYLVNPNGAGLTELTKPKP